MYVTFKTTIDGSTPIFGGIKVDGDDPEQEIREAVVEDAKEYDSSVTTDDVEVVDWQERP